MGEEAEVWQAIVHSVPGSAEVGRHHVYPDHDHECACATQTTELDSCGEHADRFSFRGICLGTVCVGFERKALFMRREATEFDQGKLAWKGSKSLQRGMKNGNI
jgi:hypothetical protein